MAKAKIKAAVNLPIPQSDDEAEQQIARLGASQRDQAEAQARHDAAVAALEGPHGERIRVFKEQQTALIEGLERWASANRDRLTKGGRIKTVQLAAGTILWREGRFAVKHRPLTKDQVVEAIAERIAELVEAMQAAKKARRNVEAAEIWAKVQTLEGFLRTVVEPNKEAMLAAREVAETIRGVTVPRGPEEFSVEPLASQIREVA